MGRQEMRQRSCKGQRDLDSSQNKRERETYCGAYPDRDTEP